jgi:hypothetical protein
MEAGCLLKLLHPHTNIILQDALTQETTFISRIFPIGIRTASVTQVNILQLQTQYHCRSRVPGRVPDERMWAWMGLTGNVSVSLVSPEVCDEGGFATYIHPFATSFVLSDTSSRRKERGQQSMTACANTDILHKHVHT